MNDESTIPDNEEVDEYWFIDLGWYETNRRSFSTLAGRCLCSKCQKKLKTESGEVTAGKLIEAISGCCSKQSGFITGELPVLESIFRILLANGNQPLEIKDLTSRLMERRGNVPGGSSGRMLSRLLRNDRSYGLSLKE